MHFFCDICTYPSICLSVCLSISIYIYIYISISLSISIYTHIYTSIYLSISIYIYICISTSIYPLYISTCIYIYIYIHIYVHVCITRVIHDKFSFFRWYLPVRLASCLGPGAGCPAWCGCWARTAWWAAPSWTAATRTQRRFPPWKPSKHRDPTPLPSGKHTKNYGKSLFLMGKSTINGHFQ